MKLPVHIIGFAALLSTTHVFAADTLYETMRKNTYHEMLLTDETEDTVKKFIKRIYPDSGMQVQQNDIEHAATNSFDDLCDDRGGRDTLSHGDCNKLRDELVTMTQETEWIRGLGRDLQAIATSYELGVDGYPGRRLNIASRFPSITQIWRTEGDRMESPLVETIVRGAEYPESTIDLLYQVGDALDGIRGLTSGDEKFTAAVWRYRHGHQWLINKFGYCSAADEAGDGSELQHLYTRWCDLETALENVWLDLPEPDPELLPSEHFIFYAFTFDDLNVAVWANNDDVGLQWDLPFEPVLPSLECDDAASPSSACDTDSAILGGVYPPIPPEPGRTEGVCSHFFGQRGYLCRPFPSHTCRIQPAEDPDPTDDDDFIPGRQYNIELTDCNPQAFPDYTYSEFSGTNMCEWGGWRQPYYNPHDADDVEVEDTPELQDASAGDEQILPDRCSNCAIDLHCEDACEFDGELVKNFAVTSPRDEDGVIRICIPNAMGPKGALRYVVLHEIVHAQQLCNLGGDDVLTDYITDKESCCALERRAYFSQCAAMEEDGILGPLGITAEMCGSAMANNSCKAYNVPVDPTADPDDPDTEMVMPCTDPYLKQAEVDAINETVFPYIETNAVDWGLPVTCEEAVEELDPRSQKIKNSLPLVCTSECVAIYENTIGNNLCYIGQCIEESTETDRILPGRMNHMIPGQAFQEDSETDPNPEIGEVVSPARPPETRLPFYRPQWLVDNLDKALCQINGLPIQTPSSLCSFDPARRFNRPLEQHSDIARSVFEQLKEQVEPTYALRDLTQSIGTRAGIELYSRYFEVAGRSLEDLMLIANQMMSGISELRFPSEMCDRES